MSEGSADEVHKTAVEQNLAELFLRFSAKENEIKGFVGRWIFYSPDSADEDAITSSFRCLRTYEVLVTSQIAHDDVARMRHCLDVDKMIHCLDADDESNTIRFQTFNEFEPSNGRARKRSLDGVFESSHMRLSTDLFFSDNTSLSASEKDKKVPDCVFWRSVALDAENVMRINPRLPPSRDASAPKNHYPSWSLEKNPGVFSFEAFLMFGNNRWSMGALYNVQDLSLLTHFCIQESMTSVDTSKPIDFDSFEYRDSQGRLDKNVMSWLDEGHYKGEMTELVWDEDGEAMKLGTRPANWNPPSSSETHRLFLYKDSSYAYYPLRLPEVHSDPNNQFGEGARFEMGVYDREGEVFRRLILRYSASGRAVSLTKEHFKADGSFEFDRRASHSVRRSLHGRRGQSNRYMDVQPEVPAKTAEHRAAKLREALRNSIGDELGQDSEQASTPKEPENVMDSATLNRVMGSKSSADNTK